MAKKRCEIKKGAKLKKLPKNKKNHPKLIKTSNKTKKKKQSRSLKIQVRKKIKRVKKKKHRWISAQFVCMLHLQLPNICATVIFVSIFSNCKIVCHTKLL